MWDESPIVGKDIDAYCTRCRMDLAHTIVAMVDGDVVKVQCNTCSSLHRYRPPKSAASGSRSVTRKTVVRKSGGSQVTVSEIKTSVPSEGAPAPKRKSSPPSTKDTVRAMQAAKWASEVASKDPDEARAYSPRDSFESGELIKHTTFGLGLIQEVRYDNKINVLFKDGEKTLIINR